MSRDILFRGKTAKGEWEYGVPLISESGEIAYMTQMHSYNCRVEPQTIGQFTGLTDKNGKKIFEGDIVAYNTLYIDGKEIQEIGYFECDEHYVSFRIHGTQMTPFNCEVIGNIHDNPELLGEEK